MFIQRQIGLSALVLLMALLSSCVPQIVEKPPEIVWPLPPEKPRIKFVDIITDSKDVKQGSRSMAGFLFGEGRDVRFIKPYGVSASKQKVYVTDIGGIFTYDFENGKFSILGSQELRLPSGIGTTRDGIFVADTALKKIFRYDLSGNMVMKFGGGEIDTVAGIAIDEPRKRLIVSDAKKHVVHIYGFDGTYLMAIGRRGTGNGEFNIPYGVAVDASGRIYVVDFGNFRIQIFDVGGVFIKSIGKVGTSAGNFARPKGIALDSDGHIYVLDSAFGNFQILDFNGSILLAVGSNGIGPAEFQLPSSIFIDESDRIYVVDQVNKRVQMFQYLKEAQTP